MKILQNSQSINQNIPIREQNVIFSDKWNSPKAEKVLFTDSVDRQLPTRIITDHVLVLGANHAATKKVATQIKLSFSKAGYSSKIITATDFLLLLPAYKSSRKTLYIILCNDLSTPLSQLITLGSYTSSKIIFKIPGLEWDAGALCEFKISKVAESILSALRVRNNVSRGLLSSLSSEEFCVIDGKNVSKRKMPLTETDERLAVNPCKMCASRLSKL